MDDYVLYWMQQSQRMEYNKALSKATKIGNELGKKVKVLFCLTDDFKDGNLRSYQFMLEGILETRDRLLKEGYSFDLVIGSIPNSLKPYIKNSCQVVCDVGYLRFQRKWRDQVLSMCKKFEKKCHLVETDLIIPVEEASNKQEYMAWTFRKKVNKKLDRYLTPVDNTDLIYRSKPNDDTKLNLDYLISKLNIDKSVKPSKKLVGGYSKAKKMLNHFIVNKLIDYNRSQSPALELTSLMSPYLHFGQIAALEIALEIKKIKQVSDNKNMLESIEQFLEQLIIRRELSYNFVYYNKKYDSFNHITSDWAYKTMSKHKTDKREYIYNLKQLEACQTHDKYWNTAMKEMIKTGYMHGYMRMYWCKKIIEWSKDYQTAYDNALYLNNKYFIDGRDANSYVGVAWCFGLHDRAWKERDIFGKLRYMNKNGLERKFDMKKYIQRINE